MVGTETFIAKRYLLSRRSVRFINVIGFISIAGITIGVAALLVALSVFNGFSGVVTSVLVGFDPHLRVEKAGGMTPGEAANIEKEMARHPRITGFAPFITGKAMLVSRFADKVVYVRGVDEERVEKVSGLKKSIVLGTLTLHDSDGVAGMVIGLTLADRLGAIVGNEILVMSPSGFQSSLTGLQTPQTMKFRVAGIFESNNREYDANYAFISLSSAQRLYDRAASVDGLEVRCSHVAAADDVKQELAKGLDPDIAISTWYDFHKTLYGVMKVERWSAYVLLTLIIVVAMFNMLGSLTMGVVEKRRDIAVLNAMGMPPRRIIRLFMVEGILIGVAGTILGVALGGIVLYLQINYQLFRLDTSVYIIPAIPVEIHWMDFVSISLASLGLSWLTAYYPARRAASTYPAEALRWE